MDSELVGVPRSAVFEHVKLEDFEWEFHLIAVEHFEEIFQRIEGLDLFFEGGRQERSQECEEEFHPNCGMEHIKVGHVPSVSANQKSTNFSL